MASLLAFLRSKYSLSKRVVLPVCAVVALLIILSRSIYKQRDYMDKLYNDVLRNYDQKISTIAGIEEQRIKDESDDTFISEIIDEGAPRQVLLNAYMRGGSSFIGEVLGHRPNTFSLYEPLRSKLGSWLYWRGLDSICRLRRMECRTSDNLSDDHKFLTQLFTCHEDMPSLIPKIIIKKGGEAMRDVKMCKGNSSKLPDECHSIIMDVCRHAQYRVSKTLRLSVGTLEPLLLLNQNLKIVHLFRDPRAIINSRLRTGWYPSLKNQTILRMEAESLCDKMMYDYKSGVVLAKKYPDRFKMILYEDLVADLRSQTKLLFMFLNIQYTKFDDDKISFIKSNQSSKQLLPFNDSSSKTLRMDHSKDYAFWWRTYVNWENVQDVDRYCSEVVDTLGYSLFNSEDELRNMSYSSMSARDNVKLLKL